MDRRRRLLAATALLLGSAAPVTAQTVRGRVIEPLTGSAVDAGFVVLLGPGGREVARTLADGDGRFQLRAPAPGEYRLRSERIGFQVTVSEPFPLAAGEIREFRLEVQAIPIRLQEIRVASDSRCRVRPEEASTTAMVWDEARKALSAIVWSQQQTYRVTVRNFSRELSSDYVVQSESSSVVSGRSNRPWRPAPWSELESQGFVRSFGDSLVYYGPDAELLFSDPFLNSHCLRLEEGRGANAGLLGLQFEPSGRRRVPDIRGTIWIDRETAQLRFVEFNYTGLQHAEQAAVAGGRVEYQHLPNGAWMIDRWRIRMPRLEQVNTARITDAGGISRGRRPIEQERRVVVRGLHEIGGELLDVFDGAGVRLGGALGGTLTGSVHDSIRGVPLIGAVVRLRGSSYADTTGPGGTFTIPDVREGDYQVEMTHPDFPAWGVVPGVQPVSVRREQTTTARFAIPPADRLFALLCPADTGTSSPTGAAAGMVRDEVTGRPAVGVRVRVVWNAYDVSGRGDEQASPRFRERIEGYEMVTDQTGYFKFCDLPFNQALETKAIDGRWESRPETFRLKPKEIREVVLSIRRAGS